jgi:hypothetical protein
VLASADPIELACLERHRRIAARIRVDATLIDDARARLARWIARTPNGALAVHREWQAVLDMLRPDELADFLESTTPKARRLRSSSPFFETP